MHRSSQSGSVPVQAMPYEVVDVSSGQSNPSSTSRVTTDNCPSSRAKPLKLKKKTASHECLNSPVTDSSQRPATCDHRAGNQTVKGNYQPLIPSKTNEKGEYQSLKQKKGPITPGPPAVPPKLKTKSTKL